MSALPDLNALALLVAVADNGSVGAAARSLGLAQPNASRTLARLERELGSPLLQRTARGSLLTPTGLMIVELAREAVDAGQAVTNAAANLRAQDAVETLTVAASHTIAEHLLPRWLSALRSSDPQSQVHIHVHNSHDVVDDVRTGRAGLGFVEDPSVPGDLHASVVGHDDLVLVVAPHHVWATRTKPVSAEELADTALITREQGSGTRTALDAVLPQPIDPFLELPSNPAVRVSVISGAAPAVLSRLAVADAISAGTLVPVPLGFKVPRPLHAVWTGQRRLRGPAAALVSAARR